MQWAIWLALTVALLVVELSTVQLISVWFAIGGIVTTIISAIFPQLALYWQITIFVVVSVGLLLSTRRLVKKFIKRTDEQKTNLELHIGKSAVVEEEIDNMSGTGAVKVNGVTWSARSENDEKISKGEIVTINKITGNKMIVSK
ncbi:MAG: NfeD family protein [Clostridia bacterium]|nr:NfeD family protein [Clostridia bacterium]